MCEYRARRTLGGKDVSLFERAEQAHADNPRRGAHYRQPGVHLHRVRPLPGVGAVTNVDRG